MVERPEAVAVRLSSIGYVMFIGRVKTSANQKDLEVERNEFSVFLGPHQHPEHKYIIGGAREEELQALYL